jgi:Tfp pilus assembly protein PilN
VTQNINLLDPGMRQARPRLSFVLLGKCLAGLVVPMLVVYAFLQFQLGSLNGELRRAQELLTTEQAEAQKLAAQGARKPDPQVEAEIAKMQGELRQAQETVNALKGGGFGERQGFAEYLRAFSRQSLDGLWLTAFTITGAGELELSGRALRADLVPAYIQRLSGEDVLTGRTFARFEMNRPGLKTTPDEKTAQVAPYLEFILATRETVKMAEKPQ